MLTHTHTHTHTNTHTNTNLHAQDGFVGLQDQPLDCVTGLDASVGSSKSPFALVLEPSRELAQQTYDQLRLFSKYIPGISVSVIIGEVVCVCLCCVCVCVVCVCVCVVCVDWSDIIARLIVLCVVVYLCG